MAKYLGIKAKIFVPSMVDEETKSKITAEGAMVEVIDGDYDQTVIATKLAADNEEGEKGLLISDTALEIEDEIPQYIVEGYQTMLDEVEEQVVELTGKLTFTMNCCQFVSEPFRIRHGICPGNFGLHLPGSLFIAR